MRCLLIGISVLVFAFSSCAQNMIEGKIIPVAFTVKIDTVAGGSTAADPPQATYGTNDSVKVTASPDAGYAFTGWSGTESGSANPLLLTISKNEWIVPQFTRAQTWTLDTTGCINGSISCEPSKPLYSDGETVRVTAIPSAGYLFNSWTGSNSTKSRTFDLKISADTKLDCVFMKRQWTCVVYMAADNDLESAAIKDINEMESVDYAGMPISVLVLIDRSPGYDQTNGNWTDTRLYEIGTDTTNTTINSKRIACEKLGLTATGETELDMADPLNLSYLLSFAKDSYPADEYALIMWGHGSGWRGTDGGDGMANEPVKAVSVDDTSGTFMPIAKASNALKDKGFSIIGFDTCFASLLEIAFEFRASAHWLIGSEGVTSSDGWDYASLFSTLKNTGFSDSDFLSSVLSQFKNSYSVTPNASISVIDLTKAEALKDRFDAFGTAVAAHITNGTNQQNIRDILLKDCDLSQAGGSSSRDVFIDIQSMCLKLSSIAGPSATSGLSGAITDAVTECWSASGGSTKKIGVNLVAFTGSNTPIIPYSPAYVRGSIAADQSEFVRTSTGWVPNYALSANSLLDMVFYKTF